MDHFYYIVFAVLLILTVALEIKKGGPGSSDASAGAKPGADKMFGLFSAFRNNYLLVYSLMMGACFDDCMFYLLDS